MYQVKVSVDEQRSYVSLYESDKLLYRTVVESPYHITEQDPLAQRKKCPRFSQTGVYPSSSLGEAN